MTVQELIDILNTIEDKSLPVATYDGLSESSGLAMCVAIETRDKHLYDADEHIFFYESEIERLVTIASLDPQYVARGCETMITPPRKQDVPVDRDNDDEVLREWIKNCKCEACENERAQQG